MNAIAATVAVAALAMVAAAGVVAGLRRRDPVPATPPGDALEDRRLALERSLADLDDALANDAIDRQAYRGLRSETQARIDRVDRARAARGEGSVVAPATSAPGRVPSWAVGVLVAGIVSAVVLSNLTRPTSITASDAAPASDAADPFSFFERRVEDHPRDLAARLDLGQRYLDAGRADDALEQYRAALEIDPDSPEAHAQIGLVLFANGRPEDALASVDTALARAPDYPEALFYRGVILLNGLDRPARAVAALERYLDVAPFGSLRDAAADLIAEARAAVRR